MVSNLQLNRRKPIGIIQVVFYLLMALFKATAGWITGSGSLIAAAAASLSRCFSYAASIIVRRQASSSESVSRYSRISLDHTVHIILSAVVLCFGLEITGHSIYKLYSGDLAEPSGFASAIILLAFIIQTAFTKITNRHPIISHRQGMDVKSRRFEILFLSAAFAGTFGWYMGGYFNIAVLIYTDLVCSAIISILLLYSGISMVSSTFHGFKEQLLQHENTSEMKELAEHIHGVISIEELHALEHGHFLIVEMKICVNPTITVLEGQTIANTIKAQLMKKFTHITDVSVQVMPYDSGYPYKNTLDLNHNDYPTVLH